MIDTPDMMLTQLQAVRDAKYPSKLERNAARLDCLEEILEALLERLIREPEEKP